MGKIDKFRLDGMLALVTDCKKGIRIAKTTALAPLGGYMNLKNVTSEDLPEVDCPKRGLQLLSYAGIFILSLLAGYYGWMVIS